MSKQAMELALEALELHGQQYPHMVKGYCIDAIAALKEAIKQQGEPVGVTYPCYVCGEGDSVRVRWFDGKRPPAEVMLYTSAPTIPQGWRLMKIEPTDKMLESIYRSSTYHPRTIYADLLAAAPEYKGEE